MDETFGRYRLLDRLGHGGMAEVFKAKSFGVEGFEKILVIKRILPELAKSKQFSDLFVHEAKLAVRLSHANIVQVFDLGTVEQNSGPTYYIAMEYVAGLDLATLLTRCRQQKVLLPPGMCIYIAAEVAKGLDHAHRRRDEHMRPLGIVHRDVSPQNILVSWEGEVKVTDFGIAKARDTFDQARDGDRARAHPSGYPPAAQVDDSRVVHLHGKYSYMSPEQARGEAVDPRSDLFSLGAVLYEMLTGVNPFRAPTTFETLRRVKAGEYPPLELARQDLPGGLDSLLEKALAPAREKRFADASRMYESLLAYLYASGDRFGSGDLSTFASRFRDRLSGRPPELSPAVVSEEISEPAETTPIEIPSLSHASPIGASEPPNFSAITSRAAGLGDRREVTALVLRLGGWAGSIPAERRQRLREIVARYGGYMLEEESPHAAALFGLGEADGRDTETAVRCALVALRRMGSAVGKPESRASADQPPSAGVHAGRVLVSPQGEPKRDERLSALLATAQEMSRLRERGCGVSPSAARNIRGLFLLEAPTDAHRKSGAATGMLVSEQKTPGEGLGRFVGRKPQLKRIGEILSLASRRRVFVITLRGSQGAGKTRLLYESERRLKKGDYKVAFYMASCPPSGTSIPLSGLTSLLQVLCGIKEGDPEERILEVEPRLRALGLRDEEVTALLFQLGASKKTGSSQNALKGAFARMVVSLSSDQLHVFAWDNAQTLDLQSLEIIENAVQRAEGSRAVFVFADRLGHHHRLEKHANHQLIEVHDFDDTEIRELIAQRTGARIAPPELVDFCKDRAKGHPLFTEELIKELFDSGALVVANGAVVELRLSGDIAVPRPLRALMASRISRLSSEERRALSAAAVLGEPLDLATLALMLGEPLVRLDKIVASLEARELIRRSGTSAVAFSSPLLREVIVDLLPAEARREMHAAAGAAYEAALGERAVEQAARVAAHFFEAGDRDRASMYFARSGQRKLLGRHYDGAARDTIRALELADLSRRSAAELGAWLNQLASAVYRVRTAREIPQLVEQLVAHIDRTGDLATRVAARVDLGSILVSIHDFEGADTYLKAARTLAQGHQALVHSAVLTEAELARRRGDYLKARDLFEEAKELGTDDPTRSQRVFMGLALAYAAAGDRRAAEEAVASAEKLASPDDLALASERARLTQIIALFSQDWDTAVEGGQQSVELARKAGLAYEVAINLHVLGEALFRQNDLPRAYASFQQSAAICDEIAEERLRTHNRSFLAYLDAVTDYEAACTTLAASIAYAHARSFTWDEVNARYLLAKLFQHRAQTTQASAEFERCRKLAETVGFHMMVQECTTALASTA